MKCPYCSEKISLFNRELNSFKKKKSCPSCNKEIKPYLNFKKALKTGIPIIFAAVVLRALVFNDSTIKSIILGLTLAAILALSMDIKKPQIEEKQ